MPNIIELKENGELRESILNYLSSNDGCGYTFHFLFTKLVLEEERSQISFGLTMFSDLLTEMTDAEEIYLHTHFHGSYDLEYYSINSLKSHVKDFYSQPEDQIPVSKDHYRRDPSMLEVFNTCTVIIGIIILVIMGLYYLFIQFMSNI